MNADTTNTTPKKRSRKKIILRLVCELLVVCALVGAVTYAWIRRNWRPEISQSGMVIEAGGSLIFKMNEEYTSSATVNGMLDMNDFVLKPVSNLSGKSEDFFRLDKTIIGGELFKHITKSASQATWTDVGKTYGYFEATFTILGNKFEEGDKEEDLNIDYTKYVFLNGSSRIEVPEGEIDAGQVQAIRVSLTLEKMNGKPEKTYIFRSSTTDESGSSLDNNAISNEIAVTTDTREEYYIADNAPYWLSYEDKTRTQKIDVSGEQKDLVIDHDDWVRLNGITNIDTVKDLTYYNGGFAYNEAGEITGGNLNPSRCLFTLGPNDSQNVTIRIWLEGEDPKCVKDVAGKMLDLLIRFDCINKNNNG